MNEVEQNKPNAFCRHSILTGVLLLMLAWSWFYPGWRQEMTRRLLDVPISYHSPEKSGKQSIFLWQKHMNC